MTLHKLSAGSGYEYLTDQVAALDSTEKGATTPADYHATKGEAPGRWVGPGLIGVDVLGAGDVVTAEQMKHLFGSGSHPLTGEPLGSAYKVYGCEGVDGFNTEVQQRFSTTSTSDGRPPSDLIARIGRQEREPRRPVPQQFKPSNAHQHSEEPLTA